MRNYDNFIRKMAEEVYPEEKQIIKKKEIVKKDKEEKEDD